MAERGESERPALGEKASMHRHGAFAFDLHPRLEFPYERVAVRPTNGKRFLTHEGFSQNPSGGNKAAFYGGSWEKTRTRDFVEVNPKRENRFNSLRSGKR